ncbi:MAG: hypothetical protein KC561_10810, partial [Myxococcales bacterium]|nr:hypothetical protein [Myxococcales bacterium]
MQTKIGFVVWSVLTLVLCACAEEETPITSHTETAPGVSETTTVPGTNAVVVGEFEGRFDPSTNELTFEMTAPAETVEAGPVARTFARSGVMTTRMQSMWCDYGGSGSLVTITNVPNTI